MSDDKILITSFEADLSENKWEDKLISQIGSLSDKYKQVSISVYSSEDELILNSGIDPVKYRKIKQVQDLPGYVILDLFDAKGKIKRSSFTGDIINE